MYGSAARPDSLCGGRRATAVPTATTASNGAPVQNATCGALADRRTTVSCSLTVIGSNPRASYMDRGPRK